MKHRILPLGLLVCFAATQSGCVYLSSKVPDDWARAMRRPAASIAGTYRVHGEQTSRETRGQIGGGSLAIVFNEVTADSGFCPHAQAIRLRPLGKDQLEITALNGTEIVATKTLPAELGAEVAIDGVKVEQQRRNRNSQISGLKTRNDAVLRKGADECLYVQLKHRATATLAGVVPFGGGGETWLRFPPES